jgi:hypothetical protein
MPVVGGIVIDELVPHASVQNPICEPGTVDTHIGALGGHGIVVLHGLPSPSAAAGGASIVEASAEPEPLASGFLPGELEPHATNETHPASTTTTTNER